MAVDPSIALGGRPLQLENPLNAFAQASQIQAYQRQNELANRAVEQEDALNRAYASSRNEAGEIDPNKLRQNVIGANLGSKLPAVEKTLLETRKLKTEVDKGEFELGIAQADKSIRDIAGYNTRADALRHIETDLAAKKISPQQAQQFASMLPANDAGMPQFQLQMLRKALSAKDQLEQHFVTRDKGGSVDVIGMSKYAGGGPAQVVQGSAVNKTLTAAESAAQDPKVVTRQVVGDNGTVTNFNRFGQVVSTVEGAGKQSATYAKTQAQQKTLAADQKLVISELKEAIKENGLIDQSTGSGAGRLVDAGASFFGKATEGDIAIGRLQPIADIVLKTVPRFEGPQSDKDTASYKEAAGNLANANLPREKRKAAANEIIRLMQKRQGQFITSDMASGNTATPAGVAPPEGFVPD